MKRAFSFLLSIALMCASLLPAAAQRIPRVGGAKPAKEPSVRGSKPEVSEFRSVRAVTDGSGQTLVTWEMAVERGNVGFNVYRLDGEGRRLISEEPVAGTALLFGSEPVFGHRYAFADSDASLDANYVVESVALDGRSVFSKEAATEYTENSREIAKDLARASNRRPKANLVGGDLTLSKELQVEVESGRIENDINTHLWVISQPGVRIGVRSEGLYRVTRAQLQAGGFNVNSDPTNWQLYDRGVQQGLIVGPNGDYIEFYGRSVDTPESDTRTYFLINGPFAGKRMMTRGARPPSGTVAAPHYSQTTIAKERTNYTGSIRNGDAENFWGRVIFTSAATTYNFQLSGVDQTRPTARISIRFQGLSSGLHQVSIVLNGNTLNTPTSAGQIPFTLTQDIPAAWLVNGSNALQLQAVGPSGDASLFDQVQVTFDRNYVASQNRIFFYTQSSRLTRVQGFSSSNVRLIETTFENEPIEILAPSVVQGGAGFDLVIPPTKTGVYYAVDAGALLSAAKIEPINPEMLGVPSHNADLVIISYKDFLGEAENWANYRRAQGFDVKVVDVSQIYEEFSYGVQNADAIKVFLQYAHSNWQNAPEYVLFFGDASYDPRGYTTQALTNFVSTRIVNAVFSETASDEFLADFNNDGLAELAVGRIPISTPAMGALIRAKVERWEANLGANPLSRGAIFAYDLPDGTTGFDFGAMSERIRGQLPADTPYTNVPRAQADPQAALLSAINSGRYIANYTGHGTTGAWAALNFFSIFNVTCTNGQTHCVNNPNNETLFTMLTCLNGYFINIGSDSLAEALIYSNNGGAVAGWASTGLTTPDVQEIMAARFYNKLGSGTIPRLGDLIKDAKTAIPGGMDVRLSWALIGDPMLKVR